MTAFILIVVLVVGAALWLAHKFDIGNNKRIYMPKAPTSTNQTEKKKWLL